MNSTTCPFCQQDNQCGVNKIQKNNSCWCQIQHIPDALIALLPVQAKNKQCICLACIESYQNNPLGFKVAHFGKAQ